MSSPREFYKSIHPELFSDSEIESGPELDRTYLEFQLDSLTSRSQEADFERFARLLCQREVCPNLLPTTGPTGGGDSKADAETYPVAETLALAWYVGAASGAESERWAFAFSAKKTWKPKLESDVAKIVATGRGYTKTFFVTNQSVKASTRSKAEDELTKKHGIGVRILDRTWILDRVFEGRHQRLAIEELKVTGLIRSPGRSGPSDVGRAAELERLEARIAEAVAQEEMSSVLVEDAIEAAVVSRSLERPGSETEGRFLRADRLALRCGTARQQVEAAYQWAWALLFFLDDVPSAAEKYDEVERRALGSRNGYDIERLANLWTSVSTALRSAGRDENASWSRPRSKRLRAELARLASDESRPSSSLLAREELVQLNLMRDLAMRKPLGEHFDELRKVLEAAKGLIGFPLQELFQFVEFLGDVVPDEAGFNALYERVVEVAGEREGEVKGARLLLRRAQQLMAKGRSARVVAVVGQALSRLYKHETRREVVRALYLLGGAYERLGLVWASRAAYLFGASVAANDFWSRDDLSDGFAACVHRLKAQELRLGRVVPFLVWHQLDSAMQSRRAAEGKPIEDDFETFDVLLSQYFLRAPKEELLALERLPDALEKMELIGSSAILLFLLGHPQALTELAQGMDKDAEGAAQAVADMVVDVDVDLAPGMSLANDSQVLRTKVLGCRVTAVCDGGSEVVAVAEWILAALEGFLATSAFSRAFPLVSEVTLELSSDPDLGQTIDFSEEERLGLPHLVVRCGIDLAEGLDSEGSRAHARRVQEIAILIVSKSVMFHDVERDLEALLREERVLDRAISFTNPISAMGNVLGSAPKNDLADFVGPDAREYVWLRSELWSPRKTGGEPSEARRPTWAAPDAEPPADLIDPETLSHEDVEVFSPIPAGLWQRADFKAMSFGPSLAPDDPPTLVFVFGNRRAGWEAFGALRSRYGDKDEKRLLRVTVVRGIDANNPNSYRIIIGVNVPATGTRRRAIGIVPVRVTMTPPTSTHLDAFLADYAVMRRFRIAPGVFDGVGARVDLSSSVELVELNVREAWQIGLNDPDSLGVEPEDDVVMPKWTADPPVLKLLEWKRQMLERDRAPSGS